MPDGVINVVTGGGTTAGAALANNAKIKRMSFTGSPEVGQLVAEACGRNLVPVKLELGGKGAAVVFDDVDVKATAEAFGRRDHISYRPSLLRCNSLAGSKRHLQ